MGVPAYIHLITSIFIPYRPSEIWFCKFVSFLSEEVHLGKCSRWHWSSRSNHGHALYSNFLFLNVTLICSLRFHNLWIQFWTVACFLRLFLSGLKVHLCFLLLKPTTRSILGRCLLFLCLRSSMYRQPVFNLLLSKEQTIFLCLDIPPWEAGEPREKQNKLEPVWVCVDAENNTWTSGHSVFEQLEFSNPST